jgi:hypothetical protein
LISEEIMVHFLISIIEWIAIAALGSMGIEYTPASPCVPTETGTQPAAMVVYMNGESLVFEPEAARADGCNNATTLLSVDEIPTLLEPVKTHNS